MNKLGERIKRLKVWYDENEVLQERIDRLEQKLVLLVAMIAFALMMLMGSLKDLESRTELMSKATSLNLANSEVLSGIAFGMGWMTGSALLFLLFFDSATTKELTGIAIASAFSATTNSPVKTFVLVVAAYGVYKILKAIFAIKRDVEPETQ